MGTPNKSFCSAVAKAFPYGVRGTVLLVAGEFQHGQAPKPKPRDISCYGSSGHAILLSMDLPYLKVARVDLARRDQAAGHEVTQELRGVGVDLVVLGARGHGLHGLAGWARRMTSLVLARLSRAARIG